MRKMGKLVSVLLVVVMAMMMLVGCSSEKAKFVGKWECNLDMTDILNEQFAAEEELKDYVKVENFSFLVYMEFNADGTYKMYADEASVEAAFEDIMDSVKKGLEKYFEDMIAAQGLSMSVDELLALSGTNMDTLLEESFDKDMIEETADEMEEEGNYQAEEGKLYLSDGKDHAVDKNVYQTYEITSDTLTLKESFGMEDEEETKALYPMVFKKK